MPPCTDPCRFSRAKPNLIGAVIVRLWDPDKGVVVGYKRIVKDIILLKEIFFLIIQEEGRVVPGVYNHDGHHRKAAGDDDRRSYWPRLED